MEEKKKRLIYPIIVEGRYDKCLLSSLFSGLILTLDGFGVFNSKEKQAMIKKAAEKGIIVLTDSDGGGRQLRSFISGILPPDRIKHVYIPKIAGKERRKTKKSKEGYLGVEGMEPELLLKILSPFTEEGVGENKSSHVITSADFYFDGFTGAENSSFYRGALAEHLGMPKDMSAKALLTAINVLNLADEYKEYVNSSSQ